MKKTLVNFLKNCFKYSLYVLKKLGKTLLLFIPRTILQRYIFFSIFPYFCLGVFILSLVNFVQYLSDFVELAIQYQASLWSVFKTVLYLIPFLMTFTIPIGALIGIILTLGHLNQNNEILAIRINGVSYLHLFIPAISFGAFLFLFQLAFFQWILPWGNTHFLEEKYKMLQRNPLSQIEKQQQFSDGIHELKIASINNQVLYGITFIDSQANTIYYAKTGNIKPSIDKENLNIPITLFNAVAMPFTFDTPSPENSFQFFNSVTVYIQAMNIQTVVPQGNELVGLTQLYKIIQDQRFSDTRNILKLFHKTLLTNYNLEKQEQQPGKNEDILAQSRTAAQNSLEFFQQTDQRVQGREEVFLFQQKLAFCVDTFFMIILGIPLALFKKRHGKDVAIGISILCVFGFNILLALSSFVFKQHILGPYAAAWLPGLTIALFTLAVIGWKSRTIA